jgi:hypothetical protein
LDIFGTESINLDFPPTLQAGAKQYKLVSRTAMTGPQGGHFTSTSLLNGKTYAHDSIKNQGFSVECLGSELHGKHSFSKLVWYCEISAYFRYFDIFF